MTSGEPEQGVPYTPLPNNPNPNPNYVNAPPNYVVLPYHPHRHRRIHHHCLRHLRRSIYISLSLLLISLSLFLLWPSDPDIQLVRLKLNHIHFRNSPSNFPSLDLSLYLTLRVRNRDLFSLNYDALTVAIGYRGRELGFVDSEGGIVRARGSSYVNATLSVDGFEVLHDIIYLIQDFAAGSVPFDTVSSVEGQLGLFFFKLPIKARVSCEVFVDPENQTINHQNCYPV